MTDYYAILGVNPTAEDIVIRAAYKALAQRYHPDRCAGSKEEAHRRMTELTEAYEVLADPVRRPKYDRRRKLYTRAVAARVNPARRFASIALDPRAYRSIRKVPGQYRAALAALLGVVVVLSAFNLYTYSGRIKSWVRFDAAGTSSASVGDVDARARQAAIEMGPPVPSTRASEFSAPVARVGEGQEAVGEEECRKPTARPQRARRNGRKGVRRRGSGARPLHSRPGLGQVI